MNLHHRITRIAAMTVVMLLSVFAVPHTSAVSVQSTRLPHPFQFTENKGQWDSAVLYKCEVRHDGFTWFLERDGVTLVTSVVDTMMVGAVRERTDPFSSRGGLPRPPASGNDVAAVGAYGIRPDHESFPLKSHALKFKFISECTTQKDVGINSDLRKYTCAKSIDAQGELSWHNNYFLGNDSSKWAPDCRNFTCIVYHDVWDGIDVEWYESKGHLEFDFVVHPGADPKQIRMVCEGLEAPLSFDTRRWDFSPATSLNDSGMAGLKSHLQELCLPISLGELRMSIPGAYQTTANGTRGNNVAAQFRLVAGNCFAIDLTNGYDPSQTLRIDPLVYSTFSGGSGEDYSASLGLTITGSIVISGSTNSQNYPTTPGTIERMNAGLDDCFISKLDSTLSHLQFSTYLGGEFNDYCQELKLDSQNSIYVTGSTESDNFPTTTNAYCQTHSGYRTKDCFVAKVNSSGSQLLYSSMIGTSAQDVSNAIIVDESDSSCIITGSTSGTTYPVTAGAYIPSSSVGCIITKFDINHPSLLFSTYVGGTNGAEGNCIIKLPSDQSLVFAGETYSNDFPCTINAYDTSYNGGDDAFIARINHDGSVLLKSTYLGGSSMDVIFKMVAFRDSLIIAVGGTYSTDFPHTLIAFDSIQHGRADCFVSVLNRNLTNLCYSSFFGGEGAESAVGLFCNNLDSIYIAGSTTSHIFPLSSNAFQHSYAGGDHDCFVVRISINNQLNYYSTFIGGIYDDLGSDILANSSNRIILLGITSSSNFPITTTGYDTANNGQHDCFITQFTIDSTYVQEASPLPNSILLVKNFPNPFNSTTVIEFSLPKASHVKIELFDLLGRQIQTLSDQHQPAGTHRMLLNGSQLPSGQYFYRISTSDQTICRKLMLIK